MLLRELQFESSEQIATLREEDVYAVDGLVDLFGLREIGNGLLQAREGFRFGQREIKTDARHALALELQGATLLIRDVARCECVSDVSLCFLEASRIDRFDRGCNR